MSSSIQSFCRTCMLNESKQEETFNSNNIIITQMVSILTVLEESKDDLCLIELLKTAAPQLVIEESDQLPKIVCLQCSEKIKEIYRFQQNCLSVEQKFYKMLEQCEAKDSFDNEYDVNFFKTEINERFGEESSFQSDEIEVEDIKNKELMENTINLGYGFLSSEESDSDWKIQCDLIDDEIFNQYCNEDDSDEILKPSTKKRSSIKTKKQLKPSSTKRRARNKKNGSQQVYPCDKCNRKLKSEQSFQSHQEMHNEKEKEDRIHECNICNKGYFTMSHCKRSNSSSSTALSSGSSRSSSFSEDCDNSVDDVTFCPGSQKDDSDCDNNNEGILKHSATSTTVLRPLVENCQCDTTTTVVQSVLESVDILNLEEANGSLSSRPHTSSSNTESSSLILTSPLEKGRQGGNHPEKWKKNFVKKRRNSGKDNESHTRSKKVRPERQMKTPCGETCRMECYKKFNEDERKQLFSSYWALGNIEKQRQFVANCMKIVEPKYRYVRIGGTRGRRQNNNAFLFRQGDKVVRVCKLFFKNTLDINDRRIRTVLEKRQKLANQVLEPDQRGKHGNHKKLDHNLKAGVKQFIGEIPKIESHYTRANTSTEFIEGSKTITSIYKDYVDTCKEKNAPFCTYISFYRTFTEDFNISFISPQHAINK